MYDFEMLCGYYLIKRNGEPLLLCKGLTTTNTIIKLLEYDEKGEVCPICYADIREIIHCSKCDFYSARHRLCKLFNKNVQAQDYCSFAERDDD